MTQLPDRILVATANKGKVREFQELVVGLPVKFVSLAEFPDAPDVVEDADTFEGNALKKARTISLFAGLATLADDSGLCVDALGGSPGVLSARYGGPGLSDEDKCRLILTEMNHVPDEARSARFVCVLALVLPAVGEALFRGVCEGIITRAPRGNSGFGYDPIFLYPPVGRTFAEMDMQAKNAVSHRGEALRKLADHLRKLASGDSHLP